MDPNHARIPHTHFEPEIIVEPRPIVDPGFIVIEPPIIEPRPYQPHPHPTPDPYHAAIPHAHMGPELSYDPILEEQIVGGWVPDFLQE